MKIILVLILASLPLIGAAQIGIQLSFDKEAKEAMLLLLNTSNDIYRLSPKSINTSLELVVFIPFYIVIKMIK